MVHIDLTKKLMVPYCTSTHPPTTLHKWPSIYQHQLTSENSSNEEIFNASKYEFEAALNNIGYQQNKLVFNKKKQRYQKRNCSQNIIWFNSPFNRKVTTNVAKRFPHPLDIYFPKSNKLHKIFNRNTVKVSYFCKENLSSIIKTYNKKKLMKK